MTYFYQLEPPAPAGWDKLEGSKRMQQPLPMIKNSRMSLSSSEVHHSTCRPQKP